MTFTALDLSMVAAIALGAGAAAGFALGRQMSPTAPRGPAPGADVRTGEGDFERAKMRLSAVFASVAARVPGVVAPPDPVNGEQVERFLGLLLDAQRQERSVQICDLLVPRVKDLKVALEGGDLEAVGRHAARLATLLDDVRADLG